MTDPSTALDAIEARLKAATPGPWFTDTVRNLGRPLECIPNEELALHAPTDLAALVAVARAAVHLVKVDGDWVDWGAHVDLLQAALASLAETGEER